MQSANKNYLRIGQLAETSGATPKTIRYYEDVGLLPPPQRAENGYRLYGDEDVRRLRFIRNARNLEFSLGDLKEIVTSYDRGEVPCQHVAQLVEEKVAEIEARIEQLQHLRADLQQLLWQADNLPQSDLETETCVCRLIYNR